ncbi:hypothetical protein RIF29_03772 [Crotalaria pallida]|uniref:Uncharacterized protein n=1 Tax=Crotalaria pallida TaxID=3830 RepID=A0AAN9J0A1_CROPI
MVTTRGNEHDLQDKLTCNHSERHRGNPRDHLNHGGRGRDLRDHLNSNKTVMPPPFLGRIPPLLEPPRFKDHQPSQQHREEPKRSRAERFRQGESEARDIRDMEDSRPSQRPPPKVGSRTNEACRTRRPSAVTRAVESRWSIPRTDVCLATRVRRDELLDRSPRDHSPTRSYATSASAHLREE